MNILSKISNFIDLIKNDPSNIDLDQCSKILSESYEVAREGLERSQLATKYLKIKPELDDLKTKYLDLKNDFSKVSNELFETKADLNIFKPLFLDLKLKICGKINLINKYSEKTKEFYLNEVNNSNLSEFVKLSNLIENDFSNSWKNEPIKKLKKSNLILVDKNNYNSKNRSF